MWLPMWVFDGNGFTMACVAVWIRTLRPALGVLDPKNDKNSSGVCLLNSAHSYHDRASAHLAQDAGNDVWQAFRLGTWSVTIQHAGPHASPFPRSRPRAGWLPCRS